MEYKIKAKDIKRGQICIKNDIEYIVTNIYNCLTKSQVKGFTLVNVNLKKSILEFFPGNYEFVMIDERIFITSN